MDVPPSDRLAKLPPPPVPPGTFTSIQRKSFTKQISNGLPNETERTTIVSHNVRRVPILRSISSNPEPQARQNRAMSPFDSLGSHHNGSLQNFGSAIDLANSMLRMATSRLSNKSPATTDRYSSSSGYDSNSSSSLSNLSGQPSTAIRRIPSVHSFYNYAATESSDTTCTKSDSSQASVRTKRHSYSEKGIKDEVIRSLDRLEKRVTFLREVANELLEEKNKLVDALAQIETCCSPNTFTEVDLQDIRAASSLLAQRLDSVGISIKTHRSASQAEALQKANQCLDELNAILNKRGKMAAKQRCLSYISSCSSDNLTDDGSQVIVPIDERFQKMVIQCSLEDQKSIKRKLESILLNIEK